MWVIWDEERNGPASMMQRLPENVADLPESEVADLGYKKLTVIHPESMIPRFTSLLGSSVFTLSEDGKSVTQTFPDADFSVAAVREELKTMAAYDARQELGETDWYIIRNLETGEDVPADVITLRGKQRAHVAWIRDKADRLTARELIDFKWQFPKDARQNMVDGVPVIVENTPPGKVNPAPIPPLKTKPIKDSQNIANLPPEIPDTTDGPVVVVVDESVDEVWIQELAEKHKLVVVGVPSVENPQPHLNDPAPEGYVMIDREEGTNA